MSVLADVKSRLSGLVRSEEDRYSGAEPQPLGGYLATMSVYGAVLGLRAIALILPPSYVFEGMRAILFSGVFRADYLFTALALDGVYVTLGASAFLLAFHNARRRGALLQMGE